jgi:hypothetical protein
MGSEREAGRSALNVLANRRWGHRWIVVATGRSPRCGRASNAARSTSITSGRNAGGEAACANDLMLAYQAENGRSRRLLFLSFLSSISTGRFPRLCSSRTTSRTSGSNFGWGARRRRSGLPLPGWPDLSAKNRSAPKSAKRQITAPVRPWSSPPPARAR